MYRNQLDCRNEECISAENWKALLEQENEMYFTADDLVLIAEKHKLPWEEVQQATFQLRENGDLMYLSDESWCLSELYKAQRETGKYLAERSAYPYMGGMQLLEPIQIQEGVVLSEQQMNIIYSVLQHNLSMITGFAGTGKTAVIQGICSLFFENDILLCAPTGKASNNIKRKANHPSYTIDFLMEHPEKCDFNNLKIAIVDEAGMMNIRHMHFLLQKVPKDVCLVLVGDMGQLPAVGPGEILKNLEKIDTPNFQLTEVFRQGGKDTALMRNIMQCINKNGPIQIAEDDTFHLAPCNQDILIEDAVRRIATGENVQIIATRNEEVAYLSIEISKRLQHLYRYPLSMNVGGLDIWNGERILIRRNDNYEGVSNGEILTASVGRDCMGRTRIFLIAQDGRIINNISNLDIAPAYAMTVHKCQGSEFDTVLMLLPNNFYTANNFLNRNLLYTALSRAKKHVTVYGEEKVLKQMISTDRNGKKDHLAAWFEYWRYQEGLDNCG